MLHRDNSQLRRTQEQVDAVVGIMHNNVQRVLDRGEQLDTLDARAERLHAEAQMLRTQAQNIKRKFLCRSIKWYLVIACISMILIALIALIIAIVVQLLIGKTDNTPKTQMLSIAAKTLSDVTDVITNYL